MSLFHEKSFNRLFQERNLALKILSAKTLDFVFHEICLYFHQAWDFNRIEVQFFDKTRQTLENYGRYEINDEEAVIIKHPLKGVSSDETDFIVSHNWQKKQAHSDAMTWEKSENTSEKNLHIERDYVTFPLEFEDQILGYIYCFSDQKTLRLSKEHLKEIQYFLSEITAGIKFIQERISAENTQEQQKSLNLLIQEVASSSDLKSLSKILCREISKEGIEECVLRLVDQESRDLILEGFTLSEEWKKTFLKPKISLSDSDSESVCFREKTVKIYQKEKIETFSQSIQQKFEFENLSFLVEIPLLSETSAKDPLGVLSIYGQQKFSPQLAEKIQDKIRFFIPFLKNGMLASRIQKKESLVANEFLRNQRILSTAEKFNHMTHHTAIHTSILDEIIALFDLDSGVLFLEKSGNLIMKSIRWNSRRSEEQMRNIKTALQNIVFSIPLEEGTLASCYSKNKILYFEDLQSIMSLSMHPKDRLLADLFEEIRTHVLVPVRDQENVLGVLMLSSFSQSRALFDQDLAFLESLGSLAGSSFKNAEVYEMAQKQKRELETRDFSIREDLKMAERIQRKILCLENPFPSEIEIAIHYQPQNQVGGDLYYSHLIGNKKMRLFIADATGHGVQAALGTLLIRNEYDKVRMLESPPNLILEVMNQFFIENFPSLSLFFTAFLMDLDLENQTFSYSCAGHPIQYLFKERPIHLHCPGKPVGVISQSRYSLESGTLEKGDRIFLFTDGLFEEANAQGEEFGEERLKDFLWKSPEVSLKKLPDLLLKKAYSFSGKNTLEDDFTLMGIRIL